MGKQAVALTAWDEPGMTQAGMRAGLSSVYRCSCLRNQQTTQNKGSIPYCSWHYRIWNGPAQPRPCGTEAASSSLSLGHRQRVKGEQKHLLKGLYSFTLPGAASCKRRVSRAGGIFTDICPKPGL